MSLLHILLFTQDPFWWGMIQEYEYLEAGVILEAGCPYPNDLYFLPLPQCFWDYNWHIGNLRYMTCLFDTLIYHRMITTIALANISIMFHNYHFLLWLELLRSSLSNIQVYNTVLLAKITMLDIRSPEFINLITGILYPLTTVSPCLSSAQPLVTTTLLSVSLSWPKISYHI